MKLYVAQLLFILIILTIAAWQFIAWKTSFIEPLVEEPEPDITFYRLPNTTRPIEQYIRLQPFINGNRSVNGYTELTFHVLRPTRNVTLHMVDIITVNRTIRVSTSSYPHKHLSIIKHTYDAERNFYVCHLSQEIVPLKNYTISMSFQATLNENLVGFYRSFYADNDSDVKHFAVSQFAPNYARYAFPCYDEPSMKTKFNIDIVRENNMTAISNMPRISSIPVESQPGWVIDTFASSVPMSSYLVSFLVSDLVNVTSTMNSSAEFEVWAREATLNQTNYALSIGPPILNYFEDYFGIPYPLPKLDMAAVPDFYYGAMENWGLIIFRETRLLYDPDISSALDLQNICSVVAHELAHQWYGNLVTMEWWDDVWLNEGFATFMEYQGCHSVEPNFGMADQFILNDLQKSFEVDALTTSHPLTNPITSPKQIGLIYDTIAYSKGASIIRMMNGFLTPSTFQKGVSKYIEHFSYSNANKDNLWHFLTDQGHAEDTLREDLSIKEVMDTWTVQMGYPVLIVYKSGIGKVILRQERFLQDKQANSTDTKKYMWWIPLTYTYQDSPDFEDTTVKEWMSNTEKEKTLVGFSANDKWLIFNVQQMGYYRVNYDTKNWNAIISQLNIDNTEIHKLNRAQILDDGYSLAKAGMLSYKTILRINAYLNKEKEYIPIATALKQLQYLYSMFQTTSGYREMQAYMIDLLAPLFDQVGFNDDQQNDHEEQLKRSLILTWSCKIRHEPCVNNSVKLYSDWMEDHNNVRIISPNLRKTVFCAAIEEGGQPEWDFAYTQYLSTNSGNEKSNLLYGMGCTRVIWIMKRYLELTFKLTSGIRKQDVKEVFKSLSEHPVGSELAWDYLREHSHKISSYGIPNAISDLTEIISKNFNSKTKLSELETFQNTIGSTVNLQQSIERVKNNIHWMDNYYSVIFNWLSNHSIGNIFTKHLNKTLIHL